MIITGHQNLITEGVKAIEALAEMPEGTELAELRLYENSEIEAIVSIEDDSLGINFLTLVWNGEKWVERA
jgi:hypothetical protein